MELLLYAKTNAIKECMSLNELREDKRNARRLGILLILLRKIRQKEIIARSTAYKMKFYVGSNVDARRVEPRK